MSGGIDLDDELMRARSLQSSLAYPLPPMKEVASHGFSGVSSISSCAPLHHPSLEPPSNVMRDLLHLHMETERLTEKSAKIFDAEVEKSLENIEKRNAEKEEALQKEAEAAKSRSTWSALSNVAQYATSVGSVLFGAAVGGIPGAVLVAAGVVGVGNRVLHDTNILQTAVEWYTQSEELQQKITQNIEMGAFFLQMGLGLAGGFAAWTTGSLAAMQTASAVDAVQQASSTITSASGIASSSAYLGTKFYDKRAIDQQARAKELNGEITLHHQTIYQDTTQMNRITEQSQSEAEEIHKAVRSTDIQQD